MATETKLTAFFGKLFRCKFPHLAGTEFGIKELFLQRSACITCIDGCILSGFVFDNAGNADAFKSLAAPVGTDGRRMSSPEFLGIAFKEGLVQLLSEMI